MNHVTTVPTQSQNRRLFLRQSLQAAVAVSAGSMATQSLASALTAPIHGGDRKLRLVNAHTWEKLDVVFWSQGEYVSEHLDLINHLMRDHRANKVKVIDTQLIEDLYNVYNLLDTNERVHILSGFRSKATNAKLRSRSSGVAKYSLHMEGRAVDINVPGRTAKQIQQAALSMQSGGVGYYASSGFVHIDTGEVRHWAQSKV